MEGAIECKHFSRTLCLFRWHYIFGSARNEPSNLQGNSHVFCFSGLQTVEDGVRHVKLCDSSRCKSYPGNCRSVPVVIVTAGRATDSSKLTRKESA